MTTPTRPLHTTIRHGMASCARYGCARPECRAAQKRARQQLRALAIQGIPATVDATTATTHAQQLVTAGMPAADIAARSGISISTVFSLTAGRSKRIHRDTEAAILALPKPTGNYRPTGEGIIDATGAMRRLQALTACGFTLPVLAAATCLTTETIGSLRSGRRHKVRISHNLSITAVYSRLWNADPVAAGAHPEGAAKARTHATKKGWAPPAVWDNIDDPNEQPEWTGHCGTDRGWWEHQKNQIPGCPRCEATHAAWLEEHQKLTPQDRFPAVARAKSQAGNRGAAIAENARELERLGHQRIHIAERLGITKTRLEKELRSHKEGAAA